MARTRDKFVLLLLALGIGGAYLAVRYEIVWIIALMIVAGALFMLLSGLRMIVTQSARVPSGGSDLNPRTERHLGFTAQLWGILYAIMSLALFGIAYSMWSARNARDVMSFVSNNLLLSGLVMVVVGVGIALYGITRLLARKEAFVETGISTGERYFTGIYMCLAGMLIAVLGMLRTFAPELLSEFGQSISGLIKSLASR